MNVALLFVTDGRQEYAKRTIASVREAVPFDWSHVCIVSDAVSDAYDEWCFTELGADRMWSHPVKAGGAAAIRTAWHELVRLPDVDYVFHLEDDWVFNRPVDVEKMVAVLEDDPWMANLVLRRQPWGGEGAGGYIGDDPEGFQPRAGAAPHLVHTKGFWLNPCVYPVRICHSEWPEGGHEHHFSAKLDALGYHFGVLGTHADSPMVHHTGDYRSTSWAW